jgi:hypothetical protein
MKIDSIKDGSHARLLKKMGNRSTKDAQTLRVKESTERTANILDFLRWIRSAVNILQILNIAETIYECSTLRKMSSEISMT